jgi:immunoglobulin-binding protein 1
LKRAVTRSPTKPDVGHQLSKLQFVNLKAQNNKYLPRQKQKMDTQPRSLRELFADAEHDRKGLEMPGESTTSAAFQENLANAIATYEECLKVASRVSLFSPNETLEDINSGDLQYLLINFHLAELTLKITGGDRKSYLEKARAFYERFLKLLDMYDMLSKVDAKLYEQYMDNPNSFSTASINDAVARRDTKIARFKEEKELKRKLDVSLHNFLLLASSS